MHVALALNRVPGGDLEQTQRHRRPGRGYRVLELCHRASSYKLCLVLQH